MYKKLYVSKSTHNRIIKTAWALAPLGWGIFSWLVWHNKIITDWPYRTLLLALGGSIVTIVFFGAYLQRALYNQIYIFNKSINLPPWWLFLTISWVGVFACLTPLGDYAVISSITQGILIYSIFEEFITRAFFIRYQMGKVEFFLLNTLSAVSFSLMHCFYGESFTQALMVGHFGFSFTLSFIVYKTKRIELTILLHMLANIVNYTLPCVILQNPSSLIVGVAKVLFEFLFFGSLIACSFTKEEVL